MKNRLLVNLVIAGVIISLVTFIVEHFDALDTLDEQLYALYNPDGNQFFPPLDLLIINNELKTENQYTKVLVISSNVSKDSVFHRTTAELFQNNSAKMIVVLFSYDFGRSDTMIEEQVSQYYSTIKNAIIIHSPIYSLIHNAKNTGQKLQYNILNYRTGKEISKYYIYGRYPFSVNYGNDDSFFDFSCIIAQRLTSNKDSIYVNQNALIVGGKSIELYESLILKFNNRVIKPNRYYDIDWFSFDNGNGQSPITFNINDRIKDKIVFLECSNSYDEMIDHTKTIQAIESVISGHSVKYSFRHQWVMILSLIGVSIAIVYRLSALLSFVVLSFLSVFLLIISMNIFVITDTMYLNIYFFSAALLCSSLIPVTKLTYQHEREIVLKREKERENIRLMNELNIARDTQIALMPKDDPIVQGFDIAGISNPASEVGGDYYDYVWLDEQKTQFGIAIADVSGKAMKAAMTAVMTSGMIYREIGNNSNPKTILQNINRPMYLKTSKQMFTALSFAVFDTKAKILTFSNAGQMQPIMRHENEVKYLKVTGNRLPLGVMEDIRYDELKEQLRVNDILIFYTDGIPEAMNEKKELFGFGRLEEFAQNLPASFTAKEVINSLFEEVKKHTATAQQHDDITVVVVKVLDGSSAS
ncbi:MAG: PP2C family protein-serine/threonine phosphatase [Bacteriovoracaceae bacterium]|nr:PP2C family protein-serine/threonine phosphatase [Bacteroidota bacterium]